MYHEFMTNDFSIDIMLRSICVWNTLISYYDYNARCIGVYYTWFLFVLFYGHYDIFLMAKYYLKPGS